MKADLENITESYNSEKQLLKESNELIENLREEQVMVKQELDMLKSKPLDQGAKGNSLFAEVNDRWAPANSNGAFRLDSINSRRVQLVKQVDFLKVKYKEMKNEKAVYLKEIQALQQDNRNLVQKWKEEVVEAKRLDDEIARSKE